MKKFSIVFALLVVFSVLLPRVIFADEAKNDEDLVATTPAKIEYNLPYPGILPDNPLYFLKTARDKLVALLISDPLKKAEFNLLTSDKRVASAQVMADRRKSEMAVSVFSKSNNYFESAISNMEQAKKSGENVDTVLHTMQTAVKKHYEILEGVEKKADKKFSSQLQQEEDRLKKFENTVTKLDHN